MGIEKLIPTLKKLCPNVIVRRKNLEYYRGKIFAIEVCTLMYRFYHRHKKINEQTNNSLKSPITTTIKKRTPTDETFIGIETVLCDSSSVSPLKKEERDNKKDFINDFITQYKTLSAHGVKAIYVFDGIPPIEKQGELDDRKRKRDNLDQVVEDTKIKIAKLESNLQSTVVLPTTTIEISTNDTSKQTPLIDSYTTPIELPSIKETLNSLKEDLIIKQNQQGQPTSIDYDILRGIFSSMNITYIDAPGDGEQLCALLCRLGIADICVSDDTDSICFGAPITVLGLENINHDSIQEIGLKNVLDGLGFSYTSFIDFCILCGCDYSGKIPGIGPMNAYKFIKSYKSIEAFLGSFEGTFYKSLVSNNSKKNSNEKKRPFDHTSARNTFLNKNLSQEFIDSLSERFKTTALEKNEIEPNEKVDIPLLGV